MPALSVPSTGYGAAVSGPLLGPVAAPRGVGMSSAAGNVLCWCRGRAHRAHCGLVLALMPWAAACCGKPGARCAAGHVWGESCRWGRGVPGSGDPPCDARCPRLLGRASCRGEPRFWGQCGAGSLPRHAGEGLAGCAQSSTHGNLLLHKGRTFRRLPLFPRPRRISDNGRSIPVCCSAGYLRSSPAAEWGAAWQGAAGSEIATVNGGSYCSVLHPCSLRIPSQQCGALLVLSGSIHSKAWMRNNTCLQLLLDTRVVCLPSHILTWDVALKAAET